MQIIQFSFIAFILSVLSFGALAQETAQTTEEAADATEQTVSDDATSEGEAAPQAPATPDTAEQPPEEVVAVHGDWQIRCRTDNDACFMYQLAIDAREIPIAEMSIVPLNAEDGRVAGFTIVTPLRTLLTEGVTLQIDNGRQQKYQFGWCTEAGCASRFAVRADGLAQFKKGNKARLTVLSVEKPDAPVILDVSLKGFTAAFDDLSSR